MRPDVSAGPIAHAITISVAEVRGDAAFVKGSDAARKQEIFWEGVYVTKANGKGNFSFEGDLPAICVPDNCVGTLTAGADSIAVPLAYQPGEPEVDELVPTAAEDRTTPRPEDHGGRF